MSCIVHAPLVVTSSMLLVKLLPPFRYRLGLLASQQYQQHPLAISRAFNQTMTGGYSESYIKQKLEKELTPEYLEVTDLSDGCGSKFHILVVSSVFEGKNLLARQRLVNSALAEELQTIHALTQKTLTPEQWEKLKAESSS
ncbi:unnamed protein product [Cyprideis torosa]|uniref:Uncharacterized protein n=1 Tax=Cyprideis torosa TaxID=163714 RepID=A0A7R8W8U3_9CRUS|nr:unnamed protein product [Cyprideis torosa]CAG0884152.1 unnamed protein product [Cyprideis torosa]